MKHNGNPPENLSFFENKETTLKKYALIGKNIGYSFSKNYFNNKFKTEKLLFHQYQNFDIQEINDLKSLLTTEKPVCGYNVTIPYKEQIIHFIHKISKEAKEIGAVNTIHNKNGVLIGYNTDYIGFMLSLQPYLKQQNYSAIILGNGGASKAIAYALKLMKIPQTTFARNPKNEHEKHWKELNSDTIKNNSIIVNCTPLGTYPNIDEYPDIDYQALTSGHILYDLIYNPEETKFLKLGKQQGTTIINGWQMLVIQAEKSWEIWNNNNNYQNELHTI